MRLPPRQLPLVAYAKLSNTKDWATAWRTLAHVCGLHGLYTNNLIITNFRLGFRNTITRFQLFQVNYMYICAAY